MEKNQFEGLDEVEKETENTKVIEEPKEYERLLKAEENRKAIEKAQTLIEFGCFNQKEVSKFDFNEYDFVDGKKYKGLYNLYKAKNSNALVYVCPLVENNEGDADENKALKPYAYDCIFIESMDEETYQKVVFAGKNNVSTLPHTLVKLGWIAYIVYACIALLTTISYVIINIDGAQKADTDIYDSIVSSFSSCGALLAGVVIALPLLTLVTLKYKDYKKN